MDSSFAAHIARLALVLAAALGAACGRTHESEPSSVAGRAAVSAPDALEVDSLDWQPSWPGTEVAIVRGDPSGGGPFTFRFRMPDGYWAHPHHHPVAGWIRVLSGTYLVGRASVLDANAAEAFAAGSDVTFEAGEIHFDGARGETVIEVSGAGPWGITFLDPSTDPARSP